MALVAINTPSYQLLTGSIQEPIPEKHLTAEKNEKSKEISFGEQLLQALEKVNQQQWQADRLATSYLLGKVEDVHQVILAMEEARLLTQLAVEVRNRLVEAYQEIARMQI